MTKRQTLILALGALVILIGFTAFLLWPAPVVTPPVPEPVPEPVLVAIVATSSSSSIGTSLQGRSITTHQFGTGLTHLIFIGGIHGGYEWNSVLLAYEMIDEIMSGALLVPANLTVHIIPDLNPDGTFLVTNTSGRFTPADVDKTVTVGTGRFNANSVDLNRNFDCKWQEKSTWRGNVVSAGTNAFSEPEAAALQRYITKYAPAGVVFWHSQANAVYASECEEGILPATRTLMTTYGTAAQYKTIDTFDAYPITGDAEGWLASIGIPAITVELSTHESLDWTKNRAGVAAVLNSYQE